jgi:hypothetical protein
VTKRVDAGTLAECATLVEAVELRHLGQRPRRGFEEEHDRAGFLASIQCLDPSHGQDVEAAYIEYGFMFLNMLEAALAQNARNCASGWSGWPACMAPGRECDEPLRDLPLERWG